VKPKGGILFAIAACASALACDPHRERGLRGRASDEWSHTYSLSGGGELQVVSGNGSIEVSPTGGPATVVRAERVVHASTDAEARGFVSHVRIREDAGADRVLLQDGGLASEVVGVEVEVRFHVETPPATRLRLRTLNGDIKVSDISGPVVASTSGGRIEGRSLSGGIEARSTSGSILLDFSTLTDRVVADAADASVELTLPADSNALIQAQSTNGRVQLTGLPVESEEPLNAHRLRARLNGGTVAVALTSVSGDIRIGPRR
jgi:hypothetical protein